MSDDFSVDDVDLAIVEQLRINGRATNQQIANNLGLTAASIRQVDGSRPASQYAYPGYVLIDLWAKAVERAGTVEGAAVTAELEKMRDEPTAFGPRTFTPELHHQNTALMQIIEITSGKPARVDEWRISEPVPMDVLIAK